MPKLRRPVPNAVLQHLITRANEREIAMSSLRLLSGWLATDPEVPGSRWFKCLPGLIVCGEGDLIKTFLRPGQVADGEEIA